MQDHFDQKYWDRSNWAYYNMASPCYSAPFRKGESQLVLPEFDQFNEGNCLLSRTFTGPDACVSATVMGWDKIEEGGAAIGFYAGKGQFTDYVLLAATQHSIELRVPSGAQRGASFMDEGQPQWYIVARREWEVRFPLTLKLEREGSIYRAFCDGAELFCASAETIRGDARALIKALPWHDRYEATHTTFDWALVEGLLPGIEISGCVTDEEGREISGASVHIAGFDHLFAVSDASGKFCIQNAPRGEHILIGAAEGYAFQSLKIQVSLTGGSECNIFLRRETAQTLPRREYNNPSFDRSHHGFLCLNGTWQFAFDSENQGEAKQWYEPDAHLYDKAIRVPFSWTSLMGFGEEILADGAAAHESNTAVNNYHLTGQYAWYKRSFTVPGTFEKDQHVILHIGAASNVTNVWLDGSYQGMRVDEYSDLCFDLGQLQPGSRHTLVIKVQYPHHINAHNMGKQIFWFSSAPGIWQSVWIEPRQESYVDVLHLQPELEFEGISCTAAAIAVRGKAEKGYGCILDLSVYQPDGNLICREMLDVTDGQFEGRITIDHPILWQYREGNLYRIKAVLMRDGRELDSVYSYTGLRKVETKWLPGHSPDVCDDPKNQYQYVYLNNRPFYIMGILDQGYNAFGVYTYRSLGEEVPQGLRGSISYDIEKTMEFGYNLSRVHIKENEPLWYHECDQKGLPVWTEHPSNFYATPDDPLWQEAYLREMHGMIRRLYNHPSIIIVSSINESWGIEGRHVSTPWKNQLRADFMRHIAEQTKIGWPHALICDNSGFGKTSACEINDFHLYPHDHDEAKARWFQLVDDCYPGSIYNCINRRHGPYHVGDAQQSGRPILISEFLHINGIDMQIRMFEKMAGYLRMNVASHETENSGPLTSDRFMRDYGYVDRHMQSLGYNMVNNMDMVLLDANRLQRVKAGDTFSCDIYTSHFAWRDVQGPILCWTVTGINERGDYVSRVAGEKTRINFAPYCVEKQAPIVWDVPRGLTGAYIFAWVESGEDVLCQNYTQVEIIGSQTEQQLPGGIRIDPSQPCRTAFEGFHGVYQDEGRSMLWTCSSGEACYKVSLGRPAARGDLIFEAGSRSGPGAVQVTDELLYPTDIDVYWDNIHLGQVHPEDDPSDERGLFTNSALGGIPFSYRCLGRYGYGQRFWLPVPEVGLVKGTHMLRFVCTKGGMSLYGNRMGRYGAPPTVWLTGDSQ